VIEKEKAPPSLKGGVAKGELAEMPKITARIYSPIIGKTEAVRGSPLPYDSMKKKNDGKAGQVAVSKWWFQRWGG